MAVKAKPAKPPRTQPLLPQASLTPAQIRIVLAVGLAFGVGVLSEWEPLNGVYSITKWQWAWQNLDPFAVGLALLLPFTLIVGVLWYIERRGVPKPLWPVLGLLAISNFLLQIFGTLADPRGLDRVKQIVASPDATGYFNDAFAIQHLTDWLSHFHTAALLPHSSEHPAGPIVFYYLFLKLFGPDTGSLLGGCAVGLAGSVGVLIIYKFAGLWNPDPKTRLTVCALYALLPGLVVFLPEFDQAYPVISMLMILFWVNALDGSKTAPFYLGSTLFVATMCAYNLLIIGAFLLYYAAYSIWRAENRRSVVLAVLRTSSCALIAFFALHGILWAGTGYRAWASFRHALANQAELLKVIYRPYLPYIVADPYDFALGAGIVAVPLAFFYVKGLLRKLKDRESALALIGLATIFTVDLSGLLPGETARVWLFLQPLLIVPAAIELSGASWPWRLSILTVQWWIVVCLKAKMAFVEP